MISLELNVYDDKFYHLKIQVFGTNCEIYTYNKPQMGGKK